MASSNESGAEARITAPGTPAQRFGRFWRAWEAELGAKQPTPHFAPGGAGDFRMTARAVTVHDTVVADVRSESLLSTYANPPRHGEEQVVMHVVRRNAWRFARPREGDHTVPAGHFMLQRMGPPTFERAEHSAATVLIVPAASLTRLIRDRLLTGPASSAEMRLLLGHVRLVEQTAPDLTPAGALTARNALFELLEGVLRQQPNGTEPQLGPALAQAAKDLAEGRLTDPDLSPAMLARELGVSVRTLHRAFTTVEDSAAGYIRRRRLERAERELLTPAGRPNISELAARWQFADSSHFIRAFKSRYGRTPAEFARTPADR